jgi:hypothetical protein
LRANVWPIGLLQEDSSMDVAMIVAYVLLLTGVLDVVVIPRILLVLWRGRGELQNQQIQTIRILRYGGGVLILIGTLVYLGIIDF